MKELTSEEIAEKKKTWKGKLELYKLGKKKFKEDPPLYRIHMMQGLMVKLTIWMIIFACVYAISIGFWVFALIMLPVGVIGNYYSMKNHFIQYKAAKKNYEIAGILKPIEEDISPLRKKWRIIEHQIGFIGVDIVYALFTLTLVIVYYAETSLWSKLGVMVAILPLLFILYFNFIYKVCNHYYQHGKNKQTQGSGTSTKEL